ncbi:MAG: hypothetical protein LUF28_07910 [Clostridiales bacterium]|nr:hypothetical protein [Clostridiales bacterium]
MNVKREERGSILLETSIVLPFFILVIVFIYSIFVIVNAQNTITHALIQATDSLAMDAYLTENVSSYDTSDITTFWNSLTDMVLDIARMDNSEYFSSTTAATSSTVKKRFIGYLTGGDEDAAAKKLKSLSIVDGLDGISFQVTESDGNITVTISYKIQYPIDVLGLGKISMNQSITAKKWA